MDEKWFWLFCFRPFPIGSCNVWLPFTYIMRVSFLQNIFHFTTKIFPLFFHKHLSVSFFITLEETSIPLPFYATEKSVEEELKLFWFVLQMRGICWQTWPLRPMFRAPWSPTGAQEKGQAWKNRLSFGLWTVSGQRLPYACNVLCTPEVLKYPCLILQGKVPLYCLDFFCMSYNPAPQICLEVEFTLGGGKKLEKYSHLCVSQLNVPSGCSKGIQNTCPKTIKKTFCYYYNFYCYGYYQVLVYFSYEFLTEFLPESFWSASVPV